MFVTFICLIQFVLALYSKNYISNEFFLLLLSSSKVMQLVGSLYVLYFPYCVVILWESSGAVVTSRNYPLHAHPQFASLASVLLAASPPINGLLYGLKSPTLRQSVQNYWRKKVTKSELQQVSKKIV